MLIRKEVGEILENVMHQLEVDGRNLGSFVILGRERGSNRLGHVIDLGVPGSTKFSNFPNKK